MKPQEILQFVLQLMAIYQIVAPGFEKALKDFEKLFEEGREPTQADIEEIMSLARAQSAQIQS